MTYPTYCNYVNEQGIECKKPTVLTVNNDTACEEHASELAQMSDIEWPREV